jgi:phosphoenolpyruvate synthase/pyruvate phosphate dikinase
MKEDNANNHICWFERLDSNDVPRVGGKNASLGEMIRALKQEDIRVPDGFATTADAYREFLHRNELTEDIRTLLDDLKSGQKPLEKVGQSIRRLFSKAQFPDDIAASQYPEFAAFLVEEGIDSISLNPDSVIGVKMRVADEEARLSSNS